MSQHEHKGAGSWGTARNCAALCRPNCLWQLTAQAAIRQALGGSCALLALAWVGVAALHQPKEHAWVCYCTSQHGVDWRSGSGGKASPSTPGHSRCRSCRTQRAWRDLRGSCQ